MKKALLFIKKELLEMLPPTIFFYVMFHIVLLIRKIMAEEYNFTVVTAATVGIAALILGKSILIADALPLFNWFRERRLIHNVVWRICLYVSIVLCFQFIEALIPLTSKYDTISIASEHVLTEINWPQFWTSHIIIVVLLVFYILATEAISAIGRKEFISLVFGSAKNKRNE